MSTGWLADQTAIPKEIYWYKVVGIDWSGNESKLDEAVPVSTFTYTTAQPRAPKIVEIARSESPCGLKIYWQPAFDAGTTTGFALFRKDSQAGAFHQIGSLILSDSYVDSTVVENQAYYYQVLMIDSDGNPSPLSPAYTGVYSTP